MTGWSSGTTGRGRMREGYGNEKSRPMGRLFVCWRGGGADGVQEKGARDVKRGQRAKCEESMKTRKKILRYAQNDR